MKPLRRILFVEDDADIRAIVTLSLSTFGGYDVQAAPNGMTALESAKSRLPDLVLLDFMMPGMDGLQTLAELRKLNSEIASLPAIFVTAAVATQKFAQVHDPLVLGVIAKPFDAVRLATTVQKLWDRHPCGVRERDVNSE